MTTWNPKLTASAAWAVNYLLFGVKEAAQGSILQVICYLCNMLANRLDPKVEIRMLYSLSQLPES